MRLSSTRMMARRGGPSHTDLSQIVQQLDADANKSLFKRHLQPLLPPGIDVDKIKTTLVTMGLSNPVVLLEFDLDDEAYQDRLIFYDSAHRDLISRAQLTHRYSSFVEEINCFLDSRD